MGCSNSKQQEVAVRGRTEAAADPKECTTAETVSLNTNEESLPRRQGGELEQDGPLDDFQPQSQQSNGCSKMDSCTFPIDQPNLSATTPQERQGTIEPARNTTCAPSNGLLILGAGSSPAGESLTANPLKQRPSVASNGEFSLTSASSMPAGQPLPPTSVIAEDLRCSPVMLTPTFTTMPQLPQQQPQQQQCDTFDDSLRFEVLPMSSFKEPTTPVLASPSTTGQNKAHMSAAGNSLRNGSFASALPTATLSCSGILMDEPDSPDWWKEFTEGPNFNTKNFEFDIEELQRHFAPPPDYVVFSVQQWAATCEL